MVSRTLSVLALAATVLAHPYKHHHFHGTGMSGVAAPTGGMFPSNGTRGENGTHTGPIDSTSLPVVTMTVIPLPASDAPDSAPTGDVAATSSTDVDAAATSTMAAAAGPETNFGAAAPSPSDDGSDTTTCTSSQTITSTVTSVQLSYVTVTAGSDGWDSSADAAAPSAAPSASESAAISNVVDALDATATGSAPSATVSAGKVSAGAFFGRPSQANSAVPTTMATMYGSASGSSAGSWSSAAASSAPSASASSSSSSGSSSSGGKRGLAYNTPSLTNLFAGSGMSFAYNWGASPGGTLVSGVEYVPMLWGKNSVSGWASAAASAIASGSQHVLSLNEPDLSTQSNVDPSTAAQIHIANMGPLAGKVKIGSPAITNGAGTSPLMGIDWLNAFFEACAGNCKVDFVCFHWYDSASNIAYFKQHVQDVIDAAAKNGVGKVWLTEFGASGSDSDVVNFLNEATSWLDSQSAVERYAYFEVDNIMVKGNSLTSIGQAFA